MKKTVLFNCQKRELCAVCEFPEGFCKHTIEERYKELCPETPLTKEAIWQLVRNHAMCETEKRNLWNHFSKENEVLNKENRELRQINEELEHFKKHTEEIFNKIQNKKFKELIK